MKFPHVTNLRLVQEVSVPNSIQKGINGIVPITSCQPAITVGSFSQTLRFIQTVPSPNDIAPIIVHKAPRPGLLR